MNLRRPLVAIITAVIVTGFAGAASAAAQPPKGRGTGISASSTTRGGNGSGGGSTFVPTAPAPRVAANPFPGFASISPAPGSTQVAINMRALLQFTAYPTNANASTIVVTDPAGARVPLTITNYPIYGGASPENTLIVQPAGTLKGNTTYRVTVSGVVLQTGTTVPTASWTFTTGTGWQY